MQIKMKNGRKNATEMQIKAPDKISANERRTSIKQPKKIITEGKQPFTRRRGYTRIEAEAGGAARRIGPNDIRDNRRRDGREGELARS